jgi:hypothetical protein
MSISGTVVQKTFKSAVTTIYAEGTVSGVNGNVTLLTSEGQSIGVKEVEHGGVGDYTIYLTPGIPVSNFLGVIGIQHISGSQPGPQYNVLINNIGTGSDPFIDLRVYQTSTSAGVPVNPASVLTDFGAGRLRISMAVSTNKVL